MKENSYAEMSEHCTVFEDAEEPRRNPPLVNQYESNLASGKGFNQSGFERNQK